MAKKYLLSIDGGGIRGIIPATALVKLEKTTGRLTRETFSFVAGTSTGAIIAAAVAAGIPATRILDLYINRALAVFTQNPLNILKRIFQGWMYPSQKLRDVIAEEFGPARDWSLNDSPIDLLITAKRVPDGMAWYFVRDKPANSGRTGQLRLIDCVTASAAAPTFFPPWTIDSPEPGGEAFGTFVDGGVGTAGNPVYEACTEAFEYTDEYTPDEMVTVSLGTGRYIQRQHPTWIWSWLQWILGQLLESPGEQQTEITRRHFPEMSFYRIDLELDEDIPLDDISNIEKLRKYGDRMAELIDWEAVLEEKDAPFRIDNHKTLWHQYKQPIH